MPKVRWPMIGLCLAAKAINDIDRANLAVSAPSMTRELGLNPTDIGLLR